MVWTLNSINTTIKKIFFASTRSRFSSKLCGNVSKVSFDCLGDLYKEIRLHNLSPKHQGLLMTENFFR